MPERYLKSEPYERGPTMATCFRKTPRDHHLQIPTISRRRRLCRQDVVYDLSLTARADRKQKKKKKKNRKIQAPARGDRNQGFHIIHTREGHRPDLTDLPAKSAWRSRQIAPASSNPGPCAGCWFPGQAVGISPTWRRGRRTHHDKAPARDRSAQTDLELMLRLRVSKHGSDPSIPPISAPHHDAGGQRPRLRMRP